MNIPLYGSIYRNAMQFFACLRVTAQYVPDMTVKISEGCFWVYTSSGMKLVEYPGGSSPLISAPVSGIRWCVVGIDVNGNITNIIGNSVPDGQTPPMPNIPRGLMPLAAVLVRSSSTVITNDMIFDIRPFMDLIPKNHFDLEDTAQQGCHPIAAITGLQNELDQRYTSNAVDTLLNAKADKDGTKETSFILNKDFTGSPTESCMITVRRGASPDVAIRWNEQDDKWDAADNSGNYYPIFINNGQMNITLKVYNQGTQPTLDNDGEMCIWNDTSSGSTYIVVRLSSTSYKKVQLT